MGINDNFDEDFIPAVYEEITPENNTIENVVFNISNLNDRIYNNTKWNNAAPVIKRISLLQGLPFTIYSYAAGVFRSNNRFNLFGLIDLYTYISRLNILGSLNIRPDITFTFLDEKKIIDNYIATYNNGLFGSALNIFMNPNDFLTMDNIIDKTNSVIIQENYNDYSYDVSYDKISKISINSLSSPKYFKENTLSPPTKITLDKEELSKYNSIIYGGIDYEQIAVIINNIGNYPNIDDKGLDSFLLEKYIFHYYVDLNFDKIKEIAKIYKYFDLVSWNKDSSGNIDISYANIQYQHELYYRRSVTPSNESDESYGFTQTYNTFRTIINNLIGQDLSYNDIFKYFFNDLFECEYNYGQIYFFQRHKKIKYIYLPLDFPENYNELTSSDDEYFLSDRNDKNLIQIYNYQYDPNKMNSSEPEFSVILLPIGTSINSSQSGKIGEFTFQRKFDKEYRSKSYNIQDNLIGYPDNNNYKYIPRTSLDYNRLKIFYTILCGLDDNLSYEYLEYLKEYQNQPSRTFINLSNIINKTYLCYYDGTNEGFKKVIMKSNNSSTLDYFNGIKKIINYNSNNSFVNLQNNTSNIIDTITNFVYNINEGKAYNIDVAKNNPLSYNSGLLLGIDSILVVYLCQLYFNDFNRLFNSDEIFETYLGIINNNGKMNNLNKIKNLNEILKGKYTINNNNQIIDNSSGEIFNSLNDLSLNSKEEFFIHISQLIKRDLLNKSQKSFYKIIEFENIEYIDTSGVLKSVDIQNNLISDLNQIEDKWYDKTYKLIPNIYNSFINNSNNLYYNKIVNHLASYSRNLIVTTTIINSSLSKYYQTTDSNLLDEGIDINNYKDDISIYESYLLIKNFSLNYIYNEKIDGNNSLDLSYKLENYVEKILIYKFKLLSNIIIQNSESDAVANLSRIRQIDGRNLISTNFKFEIKLYIFILQTTRNYDATKKLMTLFYKFLLTSIFSRDDYYKYVNDKITNSLSVFDTTSPFYNYPIFTRYIKLDEMPVWSYSSLNRKAENFSLLQHTNTLNFTITDIFIKNLIYDTSILLNYNEQILTSDILNCKTSKEIYPLLSFIFKKNNIGLIHDLTDFFDFLNNSINDITNSDYIFNNIYINEDGYFKALLICINSIYVNIHFNNDLPDVIYKNNFISLNDSERLNIFQTYKNYYN